MSIVPPVTAKPFVNQKANDDFLLLPKSIYSGQQVHVSLFEVASYSANFAMVFYIGANVLSCYIMNEINSEGNQKYLYYGLMLYLTQIVYNYLDLNSSNNLSRLEKITGL